jgi:hypothetical protein
MHRHFLLLCLLPVVALSACGHGQRYQVNAADIAQVRSDRAQRQANGQELPDYAIAAVDADGRTTFVRTRLVTELGPVQPDGVQVARTAPNSRAIIGGGALVIGPVVGGLGYWISFGDHGPEDIVDKLFYAFLVRGILGVGTMAVGLISTSFGLIVVGSAAIRSGPVADRPTEGFPETVGPARAPPPPTLLRWRIEF